MLMASRQEQLVLPDDPAFSPDLALPQWSLELQGLDFSDSASLLSPYQMHSSPPSVAARSLVMPGGLSADSTDLSSIGEISLAGDEDEAAGRGNSVSFADPLADEEVDRLLPDVDFEFDQDGNIREVDAEDGGRQAGIAPPVRARVDRSSAVVGRVRQEHEEGRQARLGVSLAAIAGSAHD